MNSYTTGDCIGLMDGLEAGSVDLILCDLPYGKTRNAWDVPIDHHILWDCYKRVLSPLGVVILFASAEPMASDLIQSNRKWYRYDLIWVKNKSTGHLNARRMPLRAHERLLVFYPKPFTYNPQMSSGHKPVNAFYTRHSGQNYGECESLTGGGSTKRFPTSVLSFSVVSNDDPDKIHPTQKPVALLKYLIKTYSSDGALVLDNCAGSGSTAIACKQTGRRYLCFDSDVDVAKKAIAWIASQ